MLKKLIVCLLVVLTMFLFACGSKDDETERDANPTQTVDSTDSGVNTDSNVNNTPVNETNSDNNSSDKNIVGGDKVVTDGSTTSNVENIFNIGGIQLEMPEGSRRMHVFVGAGLTFEVKPLQGMIRCFYFNDVTDNFVVENVADFVNGSSDKSFETGFVTKYLDKFECQDDTELNVAGLKARKITFKGVSKGDCYRDGPVKNLVDATLETVCIYNDVDEKLVVVMGLCKSGKAAEMDKALDTMLANAQSKPEDNMLGLFGDTYAENGGFSFEIPDAFGKLVDAEYDTFGESYAYYYGKKSRLSENLGTGISFALFFDDMFGGLPPMNGGFNLGGFGGTPEDIGGADSESTDGAAGFGGGFDLGGLGLGGFGMGGLGGLGNGLLDANSTNWLNILAMRQVFTKEEFSEAVESLSNSALNVMGMVLSDCSCTLKEKVTVDGMDGIRFTFNGTVGETTAEGKILVINNIKDRFVVVVTSFTDENGTEMSAAYEDLIASMKLVK